MGPTELVLLLEFQGRPERHMVLRTTIYGCLAAQSLIQRDKELGRGDRELAVVALVLHHGDRRWNAATRLSDLFRDSAPDTYRVVGRMPGDSHPAGPEDLPRVVLGLSGCDNRRADAGGARRTAAARRGLRRRGFRTGSWPGR